MDEPDGEDLGPWLEDLEAYTREYTRADLDGLAADGRAYHDSARTVWVVLGGPYGSFEVSDADVLDTNADDYVADAYATRFDGFTRETLDSFVGLGQATYDENRGVWVIYGENGPYEVRDVDAPAQDALAGPGTGPPPLEAFIDRATVRYDAGQPPVSHLEDIIFRALRAADTGTGDGATRWREDLLRQLDEVGVQAWYEITYAGRPGAAPQPVQVFDEESARRVAQRMSVMGEQADVTLVASDGSRSLIGSYLNQQLLPQAGNPEDRPVSYGELKAIAAGEPWDERPPWPAGPIPAAAEAAGPPLPIRPGDPQATQLQFPHGISRLRVTATSGGPLRPTRLLYPDGMYVDFRPMGDNESVPAMAAGVVPATGDLAPGWLQVIQRETGDLVPVHPALVSPRGVNPLGWLQYRQLRRFSEFDSAEAAGRDSALLQAMYVEQGDWTRTASGEIRVVTGVKVLPHTDGVRVTIATAGPGASPLEHQRYQTEYEKYQTVEVLIPAHHPAQDSPDAGHLFAVPRADHGPRTAGGQDTWVAELLDLDTTLRWIQQDGSAKGPPDAWGAPPPGREPGQLTPGMKEALHQRRGGPAGLPAGGAKPEQAGWQVSLRMTTRMHRAQSAAAAAIGGLSQNPDWLRLRSLTTTTRRLAADASAGRLRFSDPAWALRSWRAVWARVCEMTCDLAARLMTDWLRGPAGHRKSSRPWRAARTLHHAAAEGAAHAHGWLPRYVRLPMGSYEPPRRPVSAAAARAKAKVAARQYEQTGGPGGQLEFPAGMAKVAGRPPPSRPARTAAAKGRHARTGRRPPRPG